MTGRDNRPPVGGDNKMTTTSSASAVRAYEHLSGGEGRRIYYRAERYKVRDLFRKILPEIEVDKAPFTLHDLSMSGIAVFGDRDMEWNADVGTCVPVDLKLGDTSLFSGSGKVCRVEPTPFGPKVGIQLTTGPLDIAQIVTRHNEISLQRELDVGLTETLDLVDPEYRVVCADVIHLLRQCRVTLTKFEGTNGSSGDDRERIAEALAQCEERVIPRWRDLWHRANELVAPIMEDPEALAATKRFTEAVLTPEFVSGPIWWRSYEKPLGYPGDFGVMNYVYGWRHEGKSAYGKLVHRLGLEVAECIATRMVMMQHTIADLVSNGPAEEPARITNLGCGPAQEAVNYLQVGQLPRPVEFTLIDQDRDALSSTYENLYPDVIRLGGRASVQCIHASFAQLMKAGLLLTDFKPQDLIYSVGMIDYLAPRRAKALAAGLYQQLAPGGMLVIGNMRDTLKGNLWPMEFICDWSLYYRSEQDMLDMVDGLPLTSVEVKPDPTGRVYMLYARKP